MPISLEEFAAEFRQDVLRSADAGGVWQQDAFFELFCEHLAEAGEFDSADRSHYQGTRGIRVDGYGGDPRDASGVLTLIISDFDGSAAPPTLTGTAMKAAFTRLSNFLRKAMNPTWRNALEETAPGFGLAELIARRWSEVKKVRLFLLSNRALSKRVDGHGSGELDGRPVTHSVWDIRRLHRFATSGQEREDLEIDFQTEFGGALPLLRAHAAEGGDCESYLAVIPGSVLGSIYDRWGTRLLEQNVRRFPPSKGQGQQGNPRNDRGRTGNVLRLQQWHHCHSGGRGSERASGRALADACEESPDCQWRADDSLTPHCAHSRQGPLWTLCPDEALEDCALQKFGSRGR